MIGNARPKSLFGRHAAVATGHHLATQQAQLCLVNGGSLVDAMVSASALLAVCLPHASSLGGCGMMLYFDARSGQVHGLNGTGRAPLAADPSMFEGGMPQRGVRAAVVPTLVRLWARAHERFGRLPLQDLLQPAIRAAAQGIGAGEELARNLRSSDAKLRQQAGFAETMLPGGEPIKTGQLVVQRQLAAVLNAIAIDGERGFYAGWPAESLVRFSQQHGGLLSSDDFARAQADWVEPWAAGLGRGSVHVMPPNSVGVLMLQQLQRWNQAGQPMDAMDVPSAIETAIAAIAEGRNRIGDIERTPGSASVFGLQAPEPCAEQKAAFAAARAGVGDTTGFVAMDASGNALAMLQSVFQPFGSGAIDMDTGILLNNRMFDFSAEPGGVNSVAPGVRTSHTLNPWLVLEHGQACIAGVSPGGVSQTTTGFQLVTGALDPSLSLGEVVSRPRWSLARDGEVLLEPAMPPGLADALRTRGHTVQEDSQHEFYFGSAKVIRRVQGGLIEAAADSRRQATAQAW